MKPDPSNPFAAAQARQSEPPQNPFGHTPAELETPPVKLPERRQPTEAVHSPFSVDEDPVPEPPKTEAVPMAEPLEPFAGTRADVPQPEPEAQAVEVPGEVKEDLKENPFAMPSPFVEVRPTRKVKEVVPLESPAQTASPHQVSHEGQLVLRAIFGVAHDLTREEVLRRASSLPGVIRVGDFGPAEASAMGLLNESLAKHGFGGRTRVEVASDEGVVEFINEGRTSLVVLHEGNYRPGIREILLIVARELAGLS